MSEIETPQSEPSRLSGDVGANLVEYSMLVALIFIVCLAATTYFGQTATDKMDCASDAIGNQIANQSC